MKVLTKKVTIENKDYVLIQDEQDGKVYYGTIPYSELDKRFYENLEFLQNQSKKIAEELYPFTTIRRVPSKPFFTRKIKKRRYYPLVEEFLKDFVASCYNFNSYIVKEYQSLIPRTAFKFFWFLFFSFSMK